MRGTDLKPEERRLQTVCGLLTVVFALLGIGYIVQGLLPDSQSEFPFVANSAAKDGLLAALCGVAYADIRRNGWAVTAVIGAHILLIGALLMMLSFGDISSVAGSFSYPGDIEPAAEETFFLWLGLALFVTGLLIWMRVKASRARYQLRYLAPHQHRTAMAMAEILVMGEEEGLTPEEVAANIDDYLASFRARQKWRAKLALSAMTVMPLLFFKPPLPMLSPERRLEFVQRRFLKDVIARRLPGPVRRLAQTVLIAVQKLSFIGYYSDPRTYGETGFVPFSRRPRFEAALRTVDSDRRRLNVRTPREIDGSSVAADVVIVGSGAAGAILAYRLAERGREVLVLERGLHVDPSEFTEDERAQFSRLYADGGMQMSTDARFQVLQGMCVGGTTVVNNAVCFELPAEELERWNDPDGLNAGLDAARLGRAFDALESWLPVMSQAGHPHLGPGAAKLEQGVDELGLDQAPWDFDVVDANIADCFGCGYCNIGCAYGKKLSALDTTLPRAQRDFGDAVRIYSECEVERIGRRREGGGRVLECRLGDGRRLEVSATTVVVSAGAIGSSLLLQRSGLGNDRVGRDLGFNIGAPMAADFKEVLNSYDGLQISHYLKPPGDEGLIIEAWFNPVGAQSLFMPGWFSDHFENMRRYPHIATAGAVIGSRPTARVKPGFRGRGMKLSYDPDPGDLARLTAGLELIGRIYLAAGALRVMPPTYDYMQITDPGELSSISRRVEDNTDIDLHSSHPQGGNAISPDPARGAVDERFALHGADGVYVCDASVFPAPITVNPQLTVMALAEYAAAGIE